MRKGGFSSGIFDSFNIKGSYQQNNYANVSSGSTPNLYPLNANAGSYSYGGNTATLHLSVNLAAQTGSYIYTGRTATLKVANNLAASTGNYVYTGQPATLKLTHNLAASAGSYVYTGQTATLKITHNLAASAGSYTYTGQTATLKLAHNLAASVGSYSYTGQNATLNVDRNLAAQSGAYNYTGQTATLKVTHNLVTSVGSYLYTGQSANLSLPSSNKNLTTATGAYNYTGQSANLTVKVNLVCQIGAYSYTGDPANLVVVNNGSQPVASVYVEPSYSGGGGGSYKKETPVKELSKKERDELLAAKRKELFPELFKTEPLAPVTAKVEAKLTVDIKPKDVYRNKLKRLIGPDKKPVEPLKFKAQKTKTTLKSFAELEALLSVPLTVGEISRRTEIEPVEKQVSVKGTLNEVTQQEAVEILMLLEYI